VTSILRAGLWWSALAIAGCTPAQLQVGTNDAGDRGADDATTTPDVQSVSDASGSETGPRDAQVGIVTEAGTTCAELEAQSFTIREKACIQCHYLVPGGVPGLNGFSWVMDDQALITMPAAGLTTPVIVPGDPEGSPFYQRLEVPPDYYTTMPPMPQYLTMYLAPASAATVVYPSSVDKSVIYSWILYCLGVDGRDAGDGGDESDAQDSSIFPVDVDVPPPPTGESGFAFIVNGVVQTPLACPSNNWEFVPVDGAGQPLCDAGSSCAIRSVILKNTGPVPMPYTAQPQWSTGFIPGIATGDVGQIVGTLAPGAEADISAAFNASVGSYGGALAIVGGSLPFSRYDAHYVSDEGTVPWPAGLDGGGGASQMWVAQIDMEPSCRLAAPVW
jgi:hypothetical protein